MSKHNKREFNYVLNFLKFLLEISSIRDKINLKYISEDKHFFTVSPAIELLYLMSLM